uniref:Uncharacterized protein n=1 Tax=Anguilla anguilla TaxID=7936 RepID=A0A0E9UA86_ANGAN
MFVYITILICLFHVWYDKKKAARKLCLNVKCLTVASRELPTMTLAIKVKP